MNTKTSANVQKVAIPYPCSTPGNAYLIPAGEWYHNLRHQAPQDKVIGPAVVEEWPDFIRVYRDDNWPPCYDDPNGPDDPEPPGYRYTYDAYGNSAPVAEERMPEDMGIEE